MSSYVIICPSTYKIFNFILLQISPIYLKLTIIERFDKLALLYFLKIQNKGVLYMSLRPFRADHVGSLLRPKKLKDAREQFQQGTISKNTLTEIENEEIIKVINM